MLKQSKKRKMKFYLDITAYYLLYCTNALNHIKILPINGNPMTAPSKTLGFQNFRKGKILPFDYFLFNFKLRIFMDTNTVKNRIKESLQSSQDMANNALDTGMEALRRLRGQGNTLSHANDLLNPLVDAGETSLGLQDTISKSLKSGRVFFFLCAIVFIILLYIVIKIKHSFR